LLLTTSSFSKRQLSETDATDKNRIPTPAEQLEAACWNGLLEDILKGVITPSTAGNKLFLWQVEKEASCLRLSMGDCPPVFEKEFTIDPHVFLATHELN
jgi:hypothetical protein